MSSGNLVNGKAYLGSIVEVHIRNEWSELSQLRMFQDIVILRAYFLRFYNSSSWYLRHYLEEHISSRIGFK